MKVSLLGLVICILGMMISMAESSQNHSFNSFSDGLIEGQFGWNIYDKVKDSSAFTIIDELGTSEEAGDKALVIRASKEPIRCVTGEPVRWLPGRTLTMEFDFKVAIDPSEQALDKPVLTVMVGNSLLSKKTRWALALDATADGDWRLSGGFPDTSSKNIYAENFLIRSTKAVSVSEWYHLVLVVKKS